MSKRQLTVTKAWLVVIAATSAVGVACQRAEDRRIGCDGNDDCPSGSACLDAVCVELCERTSDCGPRRLCANGICDDRECLQDADCDAGVVECLDVSTTTPCQGERLAGECVDNACVRVDDDSGCAGAVHVCPNQLRAIPCSDAVTQTPPVCPADCDADEDCELGLVCEAHACVGGPEQPPYLSDAPNQVLGVGEPMAALDLASYTAPTNGDPIIGYQLLSGTLPSGLTLNGTTGVITGTPTVAGSSTVVWTAADDDGANATGDAIQFQIGANGTPPQIGNAPDQALSAGVAFSMSLADYVTPTEGDPVTLYLLATGELPPGVTLNTTTGLLAGTPNTPGSYQLVWSAADDDGVNPNGDALKLTVTVTAPTLAFAISYDGIAATSLPCSGNIYGRVQGFGATNIQTCFEPDNAGTCASPPTNWSAVPNADWSYVSASSQWRAQFAGYRFVTGSHEFLFRSTQSGVAASQVVSVTHGPGCSWQPPAFPSPAPPTSCCGSALDGATLSWNDTTWTCQCY